MGYHLRNGIYFVRIISTRNAYSLKSLRRLYVEKVNISRGYFYGSSCVCSSKFRAGKGPTSQPLREGNLFVPRWQVRERGLLKSARQGPKDLWRSGPLRRSVACRGERGHHFVTDTDVVAGGKTVPARAYTIF